MTRPEILNPSLAERWRLYLQARNVGTLSDGCVLGQARKIPDPVSRAGEDQLRTEGVALVRAAVGRLRSRDRQVISLRYGLDCEQHTLEEIGRQMGVSSERIRQIQCRAEQRLRNLLQEAGVPSPAACDRQTATPPCVKTQVRKTISRAR